jgi:Uma2 family endonuclease
MPTKTRVTIEDLYRVPSEQKAELVNGEIVLLPRRGASPGYAEDAILMALREYVRHVRRGRAVGDNKVFLVDLPHRGSFSPNAAYYTGPRTGMRFFEGAPDFAVEVRNEGGRLGCGFAE